MNRISILLLRICLSLLAACAPVTKDIRVSTVYNPEVNYDRLRTYS